MTRHGTFEITGGRPSLRFERRLQHPVDAVWLAVRTPEGMGNWFPDEPPSPGDVLLDEPPHRLHLSWGGSDEIRIELEPDGDGATLLRLTHLFEQRDKAARDAAGWHVCLDHLETSLGADTPAGEWRPLYEEYERRGLPTGAEIPAGA